MQSPLSGITAVFTASNQNITLNPLDRVELYIYRTIIWVVENVYTEWVFFESTVDQTTSSPHIHMEPLPRLVDGVVVHTHRAPAVGLIDGESHRGTVPIEMFKIDIVGGGVGLSETQHADFVVQVARTSEANHELSNWFLRVDLVATSIHHLLTLSPHLIHKGILQRECGGVYLCVWKREREREGEREIEGESVREKERERVRGEG